METAKDGLSASFFTEYEYASGSAANSTTNRVSELTQKYGTNELVSYSYTYNGNGDITEVYENGTKTAEYSYDSLNQLSHCADKNSGLYTEYTYDNAGNITCVEEYQLPANSWDPGSLLNQYTYAYGDTNWKDKLTGYNNTAFTYDANGNQLSYRDGMAFTWVNGRILDTVTVGNNTLTMKYDSNGLRTQKGSIKYYYDKGYNLIGMVSGNNTLLFYYDESGSPTSFSHNGTMYFYIKNLQGDIQKIVNASGAVVANYTYDAWGKLLSVTDSTGNPITSQSNVSLINPLRYRGYVYDDETGLYYLQSRYYDPTVGRFLNADILIDTNSGSPLSTNMFSYCENDCIDRVDAFGEWYYSLSEYKAFINKEKITLNSLKAKKGRRNREQYLGFSSYYSTLVNIYNNAEYNYKKNNKAIKGFSDYIKDQSSNLCNKLRYGDYSLSYNGCELIAIYNALRYIKKEQPLPKIILEAELNYLQLAFSSGFWGTDPLKIKHYLNAHNIKYSMMTTYNKSDFVTKVESSRITIVSTWNGVPYLSSLHTYCIRYDLKNKKYYSFNVKNFSISNINTKYKFIVAYFIK